MAERQRARKTRETVFFLNKKIRLATELGLHKRFQSVVLPGFLTRSRLCFVESHRAMDDGFFKERVRQSGVTEAVMDP